MTAAKHLAAHLTDTRARWRRTDVCVSWRVTANVHARTHTHTHTHTKARWITVSFITPQGAILCTTEIWRIPSLINVEAAPINIFISAYAPCWKHIQGDFKLYELISYLLRQLSMPTPTSLSSPYIFSSHSPSLPPLHMLISFPPFFFFFPSISPHCRNGIGAFAGSRGGQRVLRT